jgi:hypothetical protein
LEGIFENFSRCGNLGNIIFTEEGEPVAIDNATNSFSIDTTVGRAKFDAYLAAVRAITASARARAPAQGSTASNTTTATDSAPSTIATSTAATAEVAHADNAFTAATITTATATNTDLDRAARKHDDAKLFSPKSPETPAARRQTPAAGGSSSDRGGGGGRRSAGSWFGRHFAGSMRRLTAKRAKKSKHVDCEGCTASAAPDVSPFGTTGVREGGAQPIASHVAFQGIRRFFVHGQGDPNAASFVPGLNYDIGPNGVLAIERGFLQVAGAVGDDRSGAFARALRTVEAEVRGELGWLTAGGEGKGVGMDSISAAFFAEVAGAMGQGLDPAVDPGLAADEAAAVRRRTSARSSGVHGADGGFPGASTSSAAKSWRGSGGSWFGRRLFGKRRAKPPVSNPTHVRACGNVRAGGGGGRVAATFASRTSPRRSQGEARALYTNSDGQHMSEAKFARMQTLLGKPKDSADQGTSARGWAETDRNFVPPAASACVHVMGGAYLVDLDRMKQVNLATHYARSVLRLPKGAWQCYFDGAWNGYSAVDTDALETAYVARLPSSAPSL